VTDEGDRDRPAAPKKVSNRCGAANHGLGTMVRAMRKPVKL
jgi:hypothetical protein